MSSLHSGQWRCLRGRSGYSVALVAAVAVLLIPIAPGAQENPDFLVPDVDLQSDDLLMAEVIEARVTFVDPTGVGAETALQIGAPYQTLADLERVTVMPEDAMGGSKTAATQPGAKTPASLNVRATPGQPITILVDDIVAADGFSLADFRCNYNAGSEVPCDGSGYSEITVVNGTLLVGATLIAEGNGLSGGADSSFAVTISYQ